MIENAKRDIFRREVGLTRALISFEKDTRIIDRNKVLILKFLRDCRLGKTIKKKQKKQLGASRCLKYMYALRRLSKWLGKPFDKVVQEDIERLVENLENGTYKGEVHGKADKVLRYTNLAEETKLDYKKALKKFYKWLYGNNEHYPELVDWIDTYLKPQEIAALTREEVEQLVDASKLRDKAIISFLFDSGARVEEALNVRIRDLTRTEEIFKVRIIHTKTKPRTIHLPICTKYIDMWLGKNESIDPDSYLFPICYATMRKMLYRIGYRILNKRVTPHILRHTSATYYAHLLSHYQLCYRYGWTMASDMPNRYLDREGIFEEQSHHVVQAADTATLERQNKQIIEQLTFLKESNEHLRQEMGIMKWKYEQIARG